MDVLCLGGASEVGRNMFAVKTGNDVVIFDLGLQMEAYVTLTEDQELIDISERTLLNAGAIPDVSALRDWKSKVRAICISHAHYDHLGAVRFSPTISTALSTGPRSPSRSSKRSWRTRRSSCAIPSSRNPKGATSGSPRT